MVSHTLIPQILEKVRGKIPLHAMVGNLHNSLCYHGISIPKPTLAYYSTLDT